MKNALTKWKLYTEFGQSAGVKETIACLEKYIYLVIFTST